MNADVFDSVSQFVSATYLTQCRSSRNSVSSKMNQLLTQRRVPDDGWSTAEIELFIREVALWDSNNFSSRCAVGEREGRCLSSIVERRHWGLIHGIGRSGDVNAEQPKAAGSSFLLSLTRALVYDCLKTVFGIQNTPRDVVVLPIATGMSIMMGMTAVSQLHANPNRKHVIWSRIDQKSCIKAMTSNPSLQVHVVEQIPETTGSLVTDVEGIISLVASLGGPEYIHSIVLTTSTFAPRSPDNIPPVAVFCKDNNIPLIVNNAYGLQCSKCCHLVSEGMRLGRVDLVVQSTDKNFLVPVGGSILFGPLAEKVNKIYPGRASMGPILDLLITLLEAGKTRFKNLLSERKENFMYLKQEVEAILPGHVLDNPKNQISLAIAIPNATQRLGSELFLRNVSGARVFVEAKDSDSLKTMDANIPPFKNFGCHTSQPLVPVYLNAACAIGTTRVEIDMFVSRLKHRLETVR